MSLLPGAAVCRGIGQVWSGVKEGASVCTQYMSNLSLNAANCEGVYLEDAEYDEYVEALAEVPRGDRLTVQFRGDDGTSAVWLDASGCLWIAPWSLGGTAVRAWSASRAAADPDCQLPTGQWPSSVLYELLVAGGVPATKASDLVAKLYAKRDCRYVFDDAFIARVIEQNRVT
jgi:hypothetical protein